MKLKCAILDDYQQVALSMADWNSIQDKVEITPFKHHEENEDQLVELLQEFHIIVAMRERTLLKESLLARLPRLQLLVTTGMRNAAIDVAAAERLQITVSGTRSSIEAPSELTWALILGLTKHITTENHALRTQGPWQSTVGMGLHGKTLGLLGLGKIGSQVARIGQAFGMQVIAWSQNLTEDQAKDQGVALANSKEELLAQSDIVSIHLVLSERTRHIMGADELKQMKPTAYLINTSRAPIVDQAALIEALQNNYLAGAGLDVFEQEPLPLEHPFRTFSNVLATPHIGYVTENNYGIYYQEALEDIQHFLAGTPIRLLTSFSQ